MNMLADTHCHLMWDAFADDIKDTIARALQDGINRILVPGTDIQTSRAAVELAAQFEPVYAAVGVHPHDASQWNEGIAAELRDLARSPKTVAIGEIGLDFYRNYSPAADQHTAFEAQLQIAGELGLPVVIHSRAAMDEVLETLLPWSAELSTRDRAGVLHAFSGDHQAALRAIAGGFYIGVAGPLTYPKASALRDVIARLPENRILIETDSPFLTPQPHRGKRNEPAFVRLVALELARVLGRDYPWAAEVTSRNAQSLFGWKNGN